MINERDVHEGADRPAARPAAQGAPARAPLADLAGAEAPVTSAALHAWLDGELSDASVTIAERPQVLALWRKVGEDAAQLRRMSTPSSVEAIVMAKIKNGNGA